MKRIAARTHSRSRVTHPVLGAMLLGLAFCCLPALGQRLGPELWLPDSFAGCGSPWLIARNPTNHRLYVFPDETSSNEFCVVIDPVTNRRVARIPLGRETWVIACCSDSAGNRLFCNCDGGPGTLVIDCTLNRIVDTLLTPSYIPALAYYPRLDRLYYADCDNGGLAAVDCSTGERVYSYSLRTDLLSMAYCPTTERVICGWDLGDGLTITDCRTGSTTWLPSADTTSEYNGLCVDETRSRIYAGFSGWEANGVLVIDGESGLTLDTFFCGGEEVERLALDEAMNRLYCLVGDLYLHVLDATTGRVLDRIYVGYPPDDGEALYISPSSQRVYSFSDYDSVTVIDRQTNEVIARLQLHPYPSSACYEPTTDRVYGARWDANIVEVIDCRGDSLLEPIETARDLVGSVPLPGRNKLYTCSYAPPIVRVTDTRTLRELRDIDLEPRGCLEMRNIWIDTVYERVYCSDEHGRVCIIDCAGDTVAAVLDLDDEISSCTPVPSQGRVYLREGDRLFAVDARSGSVLDTIGVGRSSYGDDVELDPDGPRLFCATRNGIEVVAIPAETVTDFIQSGPVSQMCFDAASGQLCFVTTEHRDTLHFYDTRTMSTVGEFAGPWGIVDICCEAATSRFYCATYHYGQPAVRAFDGLTAQLIDSSAPSSWFPTAVFFNTPQNRLVCLTSDSMATILNPDNLGASLDVLLPTAPISVSASPDGSVLYLTCHGGVVATVLDHGPAVTSDAGIAPALVSRTIVNSGGRQRSLFDAGGRRVRTLQPGANSVSNLPGGVYFIRDDQTGATRRTVVIK
jgi:DNA-binding beta-propeller fold protein YncE